MSEFYESINFFTAEGNINRLKSNSNLNSAKILTKKWKTEEIFCVHDANRYHTILI